MSAVRTIKVVFVLLVLMVGLPTMAFAHSGHEHTAPVAASSSGSYSAITAAPTKSQRAGSESPGQINFTFEKPSSGNSIVLCTPGSCCCQGASSCGSGHCCSFGMNTAHAYGLNQREDKSFRLALLGWPYPDLIFGLDRPPKV
ncbi:MAG: hypothetical protein K2X41_05335 [Hyphomicrobium sp.]|nr:hypothetical protein [Hyphomicrobium sp.]